MVLHCERDVVTSAITDGASIATSATLVAECLDRIYVRSIALRSAAYSQTVRWPDSIGAHRSTDTIRADCSIPVPPPPEQRAIAAALSDVDALLGGLDRLIAKKRDLKQAAMQQLLTGQTRLPGFHGEWEVKRLGDVAERS